jgi:hypothetical protein
MRSYHAAAAWLLVAAAACSSGTDGFFAADGAAPDGARDFAPPPPRTVFGEEDAGPDASDASEAGAPGDGPGDGLADTSVTAAPRDTAPSPPDGPVTADARPDAPVDAPPDSMPDTPPPPPPDAAPPPPPDAPAAEPDAPAPPPPDAAPPSGPDASADLPPDVPPMPEVIALGRSKDRINAHVGDTALVTATVRFAGDAGLSVGAGAEVEFKTNLGTFVDASGAALGAVARVATDAAGQAAIRLGDSGMVGTATVTASRPLAMPATVTVDFVPVRFTYAQTTCGGSACTIMGIRTSGFNEQAQIAFRLTDAQGTPIPGVRVDFVGTNLPNGTTITPTTMTDVVGNAVTTATAGLFTGAFTVKATIAGSTVSADSPIIGVRGAKTSNNGFSLSCATVNVGAYVSATPPAPVNVVCTVKLVDRYNNAVGTGAPVYFRAEAGSVPLSADTKPFLPGVLQFDEGLGNVAFTTVGAFPPRDVAPLDADANQWPQPRQAEPFAMDGSLRYNPRDGLVTLVAYIKGEEHFSDDNANGMRDGAEQFIDQGEAFVDANDSGTWDPGEIYVDDAPTDGMWNPPNGRWDAQTTVWTETRLLYTGRPVPALQPTTFGPVAPNAVVTLDAFARDRNLNLVQASNTVLQLVFTGTRGSIGPFPGALADGYGFGIERRLVAAADQKECAPATATCVWKTVFTGWSQGLLADKARIYGASMTSATGATAATVEFRVTVGNVQASAFADGTIQ